MLMRFPACASLTSNYVQFQSKMLHSQNNRVVSYENKKKCQYCAAASKDW